MRTVGTRTIDTLSAKPSAELLKAYLLHCERVAALAPVERMPVGVYRFKTQAEADAHREAYVVNRMVKLALSRRKGRESA